MRKLKRNSYRRILKELRELCPPLVPVKTRRRPLKDCMGYTTLIHNDDGLPTHFVLTIDSRLSWEATWTTLVHEWAHCQAWHQDHRAIDDHGPEFGIAYANIWRQVIED